MNTVETHSEEIFGEEDICAKLTIDDLVSKFCIAKAMKPGEQYTLSFWLRTDSSGSITVCDVNFAATAAWAKYELTFTAAAEDLLISFGAVGTYYLYHTQLEVGNVATDWRPAPEDAAASIAAANGDIQFIREYTAQVAVDVSGIRTSVKGIEGAIEGVADDLQNTKGSITTLEQTASQFKLEIQNINNNGVGKVSNTTGVFDETGMTIDNTESSTKTTVTPDGMKVYRKSGSSSDPVLSATSSGVDATNLHAKTYLIISDRSRFENYGSNRTGCFWIGEAS